MSMVFNGKPKNNSTYSLVSVPDDEYELSIRSESV